MQCPKCKGFVISDPPCCVIYFTDMECYDFGPEPDYPVLWVNYGPKCDDPPFGEVIRFKFEE